MLRNSHGELHYTTQTIVVYGYRYNNITDRFNSQLQKTRDFFLGAKMIFGHTNILIPTITYPAKLAYFASMMRTNAPFDIKRTTFSKKALSNYDKGLYYDQAMTPDDFGNYNYGYAARNFGLTLGEALAGAGIYQTFFQGGGDPSNIIGFGDYRRDTQMIIQGYFHPYFIRR